MPLNYFNRYRKLNSDEKRISPPFIKLDEKQLFNHLKFRDVLAASSVIIKTEIGKELKFSEKFSHNNDWHLWLRITAKYKSSYVPETLHTYRIHANNDTKIIDIISFEDAILEKSLKPPALYLIKSKFCIFSKSCADFTKLYAIKWGR